MTGGGIESAAHGPFSLPVVVLVFFMFFVLVAPFPVFFLPFVIELLELYVRATLLIQPGTVEFIFFLIPVVIILVTGIVNPPFVLLLFGPFMVILRPRQHHGPEPGHQRSRHKQLSNPLTLTTHIYPSRSG